MIHELYLLGEVKKDVVFLGIDNPELFQLWPHYRLWFISSYISLLIAITLFFVLLISTVIAGKSILNIMSQKVPLALSCCCNSCEQLECGQVHKVNGLKSGNEAINNMHSQGRARRNDSACAQLFS